VISSRDVPRSRARHALLGRSSGDRTSCRQTRWPGRRLCVGGSGRLAITHALCTASPPAARAPTATAPFRTVRARPSGFVTPQRKRISASKSACVHAKHWPPAACVQTADRASEQHARQSLSPQRGSPGTTSPTSGAPESARGVTGLARPGRRGRRARGSLGVIVAARFPGSPRGDCGARRLAAPRRKERHEPQRGEPSLRDNGSLGGTHRCGSRCSASCSVRLK
jgi:hypothetical protein